MDKFERDYLKMDINMIISEMVHRHPEVGKTAFLYIPFHFRFGKEKLKITFYFSSIFFPRSGTEMEWKRNGKKTEIKLNLNLNGIEWNWNGNEMDNFEQKYSIRNGMEREWNWNEKKK